jgi:hypothetical protein
MLINIIIKVVYYTLKMSQAKTKTANNLGCKHNKVYKYNLIIVDDKGEEIKNKKYTSLYEVADDNKLIKNRQVAGRIAGNYEYSPEYLKFKNYKITRIYERIIKKKRYKRVLIED